MRSKHEMTDGRRSLAEILTARPPESPDWNEAQNRFQFIDRLLTECLGWQKPDISVEAPDGADGRIDYEMGNPPKAILEAKREARHFGDLPSGSPSRVRKIKPLLEASKELLSAFNQCLQYCALRGSPLGIVCNGPQLMIFQAFGPHGPPDEGECYFFNGLKAYRDDFTLLWTLLSPDGVGENRAYRDIAIHRSPRIPPKALESIPDPEQYRYRSDFQEDIRTLSLLLLEEIEESQEVRAAFYKDCYVPIEANNRHTMLSKQIIANRYRRVTGTRSPPKTLRAATSNRPPKAAIFPDHTLERGYADRPIVLLGDVGVGKTSFFENLYFQLDQETRDDTYFLHINLGHQAALTSNLSKFIIDEIKDQLRQGYSIDIDAEDFVRAARHEDLIRFDDGPNGRLKEANPSEYELRYIDYLNDLITDRAKHLRSALAHLCHGRRQQIIIVVDNADQRDFDTQQEAFLAAQELAASGSCLVFVALRPSTFYTSKERGALSGYQNKIFTISPPPADEVIKRRLQFAIRVAEGKQQLAAIDRIRFRFQGIVLLLRATLRSIRSNDEIRAFLGNISGGNTRSVIELVTSFFGSPNVESEKIIKIEERSGQYQVPLHEFSKHALLGEYSYYNPHSSLYACNVFDISMADSREHFLKPLILAFLYSNSGLANRDGYVPGKSVVEEMLKLSFLEEQCRHSLRKLARNRLVETPHSHFREIDVDEGVFPEVFPYRTTSIGLYHWRRWISTFSFLDAVSIDTPIIDEECREIVCELADSFQISDRLKKAKAFRAYLEVQWQASGIGVTYFDFSELIKQQEESFRTVDKVVRASARS